jgi:hypothetical protein
MITQGSSYYVCNKVRAPRGSSEGDLLLLATLVGRHAVAVGRKKKLGL